ncbi:Lysophospholipase D GDPD3 [Varanus komodoensis]|nr:Lysophospholipase D GDPD3 [Varanus komodoensis]
MSGKEICWLDGKGSGERIENTMEAFRHALNQGTNLLEIDCHMTKDGVVVVSHDNNLERQTGYNIEISETNYEDLPHYKNSLEVTFSPGCFSHGRDHRIPSLEEVFQEFPGVPINIEIKEDNDELIQKNKDMPYIFSLNRGITVLLLYYVGLLPFVPLKESFLEFVLPSIMNRTYFPVKKGFYGALLAKFAHKMTMRKKLFKHLEDRGIQILLWVLNEDKDFEEAFSYGVTGVMTDYPTLLRKYLDSHPPLLNK